MKFNKQDVFESVYKKLSMGTSFTMFIGGVRIQHTNTSNEVIVNNGEDITFKITDDTPIYDIGSEIVNIANNPKYFLSDELLEEVSSAIHNHTQNPEETVFTVHDVSLHWIPTDKTIVILSDDYYRVDLKDISVSRQSEREVASCILNILLKRENPKYSMEEKLVKDKEREFFDKITELESRSSDDNTQMGIGGLFIMERKDLGHGFEVLVLTDNLFTEFSILTVKGDVVYKSNRRYHNNPSTINSLAWDYVTCTDVEALMSTN